MLTLALLAVASTDSPTSQTDLLTLITGLTAPGLLALGVIGFWKEWIVPGSRHRAALKQRDDIQKQLDDFQSALVNKVIPVITESQITMRQLGALIQTDVSLREPRRSE